MKGVYVLLIELNKDLKIKIGKLGKIEFKKGYYAYVGSALNSLEKRIERHFRKNKRSFWHIDYFLEKAKIKEFVYAEINKRKECEIAKLNLKFIKGFGCSDCKCKSHLFYSKNYNYLKRKILESFQKNNLRPIIKKELWMY